MDIDRPTTSLASVYEWNRLHRMKILLGGPIAIILFGVCIWLNSLRKDPAYGLPFLFIMAVIVVIIATIAVKTKWQTPTPDSLIKIDEDCDVLRNP